ncbi:MAG: 3-methyl-2-oxobutanoate dehydrogenase subunit VorB [Candidatus Gastranaerophilales bacterium]|nr:3-methyl-2-oxobutanoate dehydrogenase subunit VorB [Candidatus Gastranaerophilales bacterium]
MIKEKELLKGNYAMAQAALNAGCQAYFGYPITPQTEVGEYLSGKMPEMGRAFVSAESEVAAINMLIGAGSTGIKAMTSSSSCAIGLMQEGLSFLCGDEVPCVLMSVMRGGPGLGYIHPSQGDYFQATKGGGNGDYKLIVFAPSNVQESIDLTYKCFYVSQKYRTPVCLLADGMIGQMMEPAVFGEYPYPEIDQSSWALDGAKDREPRCIRTIERDPVVLERRVEKLFRKYEQIAQEENMFEEYKLDDAKLAVTAFGSIARITKSAIRKARENGMKVGLFRPIMLNPFPQKEIAKLASKVDMILDVELNMGQMVQDVRASVETATPVKFYGRAAGKMMTVEEIYAQIEDAYTEMSAK